MFSNPVYRKIRNLINNYYDLPMMQKIKNDGDKSVYMCRIQSMLLHDHRYLIVVCPIDDSPVGVRSHISDLSWECLQARILENEDYMSLSQHSYEPKRDAVYLMDVSRIYQSEDYSIYDSSNHQIEITLLNTVKDKYEYPDKGTLLSCLETFQTIIRCKS